MKLGDIWNDWGKVLTVRLTPTPSLPWLDVQEIFKFYLFYVYGFWYPTRINQIIPVLYFLGERWLDVQRFVTLSILRVRILIFYANKPNFTGGGKFSGENTVCLSNFIQWSRTQIDRLSWRRFNMRTSYEVFCVPKNFTVRGLPSRGEPVTGI